ncbi:restriction endonuclease subunit S [Clostridium perfringens]|nr:restriction endonuclease subunit S [Clostridium perfringens]
MKEYKLKDIAKIISGGTAPKENFFDESIGIPFIRAGHLEMLCNGNSMDYIPKIKDEKLKGLVKVPKDTIVFAKSGMSCMKARVYKLEKEAYIVNHLVGIICDELVEPNYLKYYFKYNKPNKLVLDSSYPSIRLSDISEIRIKLPSNEIQLKVSNILDKAQNLIDKRKEQLEALDELVKSKFIEMFGDPVTNLKKWDKVAIGEMFEIKTGATPSRKENSYWEGGTIPWVKTTELKEYIINETEEYITEDGFNNSSVNLLPKDTILIAMYGQGKTRGMTGKLGIEATTNQACAAILPNNNENMDFVWYQLRLLYDELRALGQGGSQPNLNTNLVKTYQLIFPPVELQNEFERFIKHIDKLKFEIEKSLKELEDNFNSLMQKAFKGKLFK